MLSIDRTALGVGLLFAIPPGVGIWLATLRVTGGTMPLFAAGVGALTAALLFTIVVLLASWGQVSEQDLVT